MASKIALGGGGIEEREGKTVITRKGHTAEREHAAGEGRKLGIGKINSHILCYPACILALRLSDSLLPKIM